MNVGLQQLSITTVADRRILTVGMPVAWRAVVGVLAVAASAGAVKFADNFAPVAVGAIVLIAVAAAFLTNTVVVDASARAVLVRSGIGPVTFERRIPFDTIKLVCITDGGTAVLAANRSFGSPPPKPYYSLSVELVDHRNPVNLINTVPLAQIVAEAKELARISGKELFIPSQVEPPAG